MGEWSEYFEDFPEENSANYVKGRFDPKGAEALRATEAKRRQDQGKLNAEIHAIIQKHRPSGVDTQ
ncbi:hypothetical protein J8I82_29780 [Cupriavidus sp. LEh25]|nr:hypothetical protein [Cupriavidus sp. LEh25]